MVDLMYTTLMFCHFFFSRDTRKLNDVALQLVLGELHMAHRHGQAQHLLHLELHSVKDALHLLSGILAVGDHRGELSSSVQTRSYQSGKLLDQSIRSEEGVVLLAELADHLLVLVDGGDLIHVHAGDVLLLAQLLVLIVHEHAHVDLGTSGVRELEGTSETLVLGRVNLLQSDLKLHGLHESSLLSLQSLTVHLNLLSGRVVQNVIKSLAQSFAVNLTRRR